MLNQRLDKWLWAARFFKTRQLAAQAVRGGKVHVNGARCKPAKEITAGDELSISRGPYVFEIRVEGLAAQRQSAKQAQELYTEFEESLAQRQRLALQLKSLASQILYDRRRPAGRNRRQMRSLKRSDK